MKPILLLLAGLVLTTQIQAQSNARARLAIVPETSEAGTAVDVLTAEFSKNDNVQLLERAEIERVYREQGLSAANRDDLKLGRLLGADGLLLVGTSSEGTNQFLNVRLVAVKPGVVLVAERFPWPIKDLTEWSPVFAKHLDVMLPKLAVLTKDAIPVSVVNLRSAIQSDEGRETEAQLKWLTIQRLSLEPQLFVLERQRLEILSEEKALKSDESAFWDGSYLLEGVVGQNGYSPTMVTNNARLTPPKGGIPIQFEVSGSRTNLTDVVNRLATKVEEALKVNSTIQEWNAKDEAQQYFDEAKWALKWGLYPEAQSAAESAWALGKHDMDCAIVRITSFANPPNIVTLSFGEGSYAADANSVYAGDELDRKRVVKQIKSDSATGVGVVFAFNTRGIAFASITSPPDPWVLSRLIRALELYRDISHTMLSCLT